MARAYQSTVRAEQVELTRERLLATAAALLEKEGIDALTLPRLAQVASVSTPTAYRYFATTDELLRALLEWIRPRLGQTRERLFAVDLARAEQLPLENFARFEENAAVLRPLMDSAAFNRIRVTSMAERKVAAAEALRRDVPGAVHDADLQVASGALWTLSSPQTWRWLRDTWALDPDDAARAASWAIRVLADALRKGDGPTSKKTTAKKTKRSSKKKGKRS
jgi:AcrR family transcriptional regulator